ncbi:uncharacterized protein LOC112599534 [Melanaphis sacchari]|uniref:uncharacterized protein LOC112599534 n=1 Tax=Melanaphis sacchari TaxID=742174 RepID=UPI000DC14140|nr:uncharacterized protein LOC112599534 [Melanaphis sacchari]
MNSRPSSATSRKETIRFNNSVLRKNARIMRSFRKCSRDCWNSTETKTAVCFSKSSAQNSGGSQCSSGDDDDDRETCYISLFQVCMNYMFPKAFPMPTTEYRFRIKNDCFISDPTKKITGKILSPVGKYSKFPKGIFLLSPSENRVIKLYCPGDKDNRSKCRNVEMSK